MRNGRVLTAIAVGVVLSMLGLTWAYAATQWSEPAPVGEISDAASPRESESAPEPSESETKPESQDPEPVTELTLTVEHTMASESVSVTLQCDPAGGDHPDADAACQRLAEVGGDLTALEAPKDEACTMEARPMAATATGFWNGEEVSFQETYGNPCVMGKETGAIFQFADFRG